MGLWWARCANLVRLQPQRLLYVHVFLNSATATQRPRPARASTPATIGCSRKLYRHCTISKDASHAPTSAMHRPGTALCESPLVLVGLRVLLFDPLRVRKQLWHIFLHWKPTLRCRRLDALFSQVTPWGQPLAIFSRTDEFEVTPVDYRGYSRVHIS